MHFLSIEKVSKRTKKIRIEDNFVIYVFKNTNKKVTRVY